MTQFYAIAFLLGFAIAAFAIFSGRVLNGIDFAAQKNKTQTVWGVLGILVCCAGLWLFLKVLAISSVLQQDLILFLCIFTLVFGMIAVGAHNALPFIENTLKDEESKKSLQQFSLKLDARIHLIAYAVIVAIMIILLKATSLFELITHVTKRHY